MAGDLDVAMLDIAMAARALALLRATFAADARPLDQLPALLDALFDAADRWTHVGVRSFPPGDGAAEDRFRALVREARSREGLEVGVLFDDRTGYRDGARHAGLEVPMPLALVSVVLMTTAKLPETEPARFASGLSLLGSMRGALVDVVGCEITWMPSERTVDGMTRAELETRAPRLRRA